MPARMVLHEGDAFPLKRLGKQNRRFALGAGGSIKGREQSGQVMPVNYQGLPAKAGPTGAITLHVVLQHGRIALTESIDIHNGTEIIQPMMASDLCSLPHRSFDRFSITHQDIGSVIKLVDILRIECDSDTDRQSLPQRT